MMRPLRKLGLALAGTLLPQAPSVSGLGAQVDLRLDLRLDTTSFFEGEPIYFAAVVRNEGSDTAWVWLPQVTERNLQLKLESEDGYPLSRGGLYGTPIFVNYRGAPMAPGDTEYNVGLLQILWGVRTELWSTTYTRELPPGGYTLRGTYWWAVPGQSEVRDSVVSDVLTCDVRARSPAEEARYQEVIELQRELRAVERAWKGDRGSMMAGQLLEDFVRRRLAEDSNDSFVPYLVTEVANSVSGAGRLAPSQWEFFQATRLQVAAARRNQVAGANAALAYEYEDPRAALANLHVLGESLSSAVVRGRQRKREARQ